ncbi:P-loop NTPase fold protein [Campylobacter molothri]|uniref:P-loop NTPase fold protein n=1 Tax=Campylobacter molothri TaxID=1032242 RepID=UPI00301BF606
MEYKEQIRNFLKDKENYSLLITGSWGVGKTYLWKEIENEINPADDEIKFWDEFKSNFSFCNHVLLLIKFIKTYIINFFIFIKDYFLNELRTKPTKKNIIHISLFDKEHYKEILEEITLKAYIYKKILYLFRNVTFWKISVGTFLQFFIKDDFKNLIVCFDDLERKSNKLNMKDILELINKLKEEKCKVVLISNKDEINKEDKEIFEDYKEKCIDLEMQIESRTEVISQILKEKSPEISKEIVSGAIYKIINLRNLNKIINTFKFFNKELQFSEYLKKENEYKELFKFVFKKIILKFEAIDLNDTNKKKKSISL